jgi:curved DNA-binding protein CbpA
VKNYYEILGVSVQATPDCIRDAYRKLAKKFHPDLNQGDPFFTKHFLLIREAYNVLSTPQQRLAFDRIRRSGQQDLGKEIEHKVLAYCRRNRAFEEQRKAYQRAHPMESGYLNVFGYCLLGWIALTIFVGCIYLIVYPTLPTSQLFGHLLVFTKYLLGGFVGLMMLVWMVKCRSAKL